MKTKIKKVLFLLVTSFILPLSLQAETFTSKATLIAAITMTEGTALNFGRIMLKGSNSSIITLGYSNDTSSSGQSIAGSGALTGQYQLTGTPSTPVTISVSKVSDMANGSNTIPTTYTVQNSSITLDSNGSYILKVGGTISVSASSATGLYTGQLNIIATY